MLGSSKPKCASRSHHSDLGQEQGGGREAGDRKNWNRKNMAGFTPRVVAECVCVYDENDPFYSGCNGSPLTVSLAKVPEGKNTL